MSFIEIYERTGCSVYEHAVARTGITVADDFTAPLQLTVRRRVVQRPQQLGGGDALRVVNFAELRRHHSGKKRQDLAPMVVVSHEMRRSGEPARLQMAKQTVNERCVGRSWTPHGIAQAHNSGSGSAAGKFYF